MLALVPDPVLLLPLGDQPLADNDDDDDVDDDIDDDKFALNRLLPLGDQPPPSITFLQTISNHQSSFCRADESEIDHMGGCPSFAECCTEYGYCHPRVCLDLTSPCIN